ASGPRPGHQSAAGKPVPTRIVTRRHRSGGGGGPRDGRSQSPEPQRGGDERRLPGGGIDAGSDCRGDAGHGQVERGEGATGPCPRGYARIRPRPPGARDVLRPHESARQGRGASTPGCERGRPMTRLGWKLGLATAVVVILVTGLVIALRPVGPP